MRRNFSLGELLKRCPYVRISTSAFWSIRSTRVPRSPALLDALKECRGWEEELQGKTVAGTSAGVCFLSRYYYSLSNLEVREGLGLLPVKALVHYRSDYNAPNIDWDVAYQTLDEYGENLPILALPEGGFEIIEKTF
ncbi:MAG: hypothetical protein V4682_02890 [Patescibacteria group bacterium]